MSKAPAPPYVGPANRHGGKGNKPIKRIVLHSTVGPTKPGSARNIAHMFNTTSRAASAHYIVDAGEVVQDLYDSYVAYHAPPNSGSLGVEICDNPGPSESRPYSVGRWADGDHRKALLLTAELVAGLCKAYGIPIRKLSPSELRAGKKGICGHIDISHAWRQTTHWDPGEFPWTEFIRLVKKAADGADIGAEVVNAGSSGGSSGGGGSTYTVVSADAPLGLYDKDGEGRTRVEDWQADALGYSDKAADGYFGSDTEGDTKALQRQLGVTADGLVGDDTLAAWKKAGSPKLGKATKPKPSKSSGNVPGPGYDFPWPKGHYIGPKDGPDRSHSGFYKNKKWSGKYDEEWLKALPEQLIRRGWSIGKGKTYLSKFGNDGHYGSEYAALIRAFQNAQGLAVDELGGREVWDEAFKRPVT